MLAVQAPPSITQQPQNQITSPGGNPTFSVIAAGGGLRYRWLFYGTNLPGATASTISLFNVQPDNSGPYAVVISNISGVVTSDTAYLVMTAPAIISDPQSQRVHLGDNVTLSAGITGDQPLSYQWRKNGSNLNGATNASLNFASIGVADGADYLLVVSNPLRSVTSGVATISFLLLVKATDSPTLIEPASVLSTGKLMGMVQA